MNSHANLITMLDELNLPVAAERLTEILNSPELSNYSPQYMDTMDRRYMTNLRLSRLINKNAQVENLVTSSARRYNEEVVQQLRSFQFAEDRLNVGIYGVTAAGKYYFMSAFCREACRLNYRCVYIDY